MTEKQEGMVPTKKREAVRHFQMPDTLGGKLRVWRFLIARRFIQVGVLALFIGTVHWGWTLFDRLVLTGNMSSSRLLDIIPLSDPFAVLQVITSLHWPHTDALIGAAIVLVFYLLLGGRVFCAWTCPVNLVADLANWLREKWGIRSLFVIPSKTRYWALLLALVLSFILGVAAFEWVSPIAIMHRELIYGIGLGFIAVFGIFIFDLLIMARGWCGHLCPLGAFWSIVGRTAQVRVAFDDASCTRCGDCVKECPEPSVLSFKEAAQHGMVRSGECTNCGKCIVVCPENSLSFNLRACIRSNASLRSEHGSTS
ncbi:MAG: quinol dehydrogenase ferredoxin subunit NapH [Burkholderiales bacterium]|jgi:ferredoxin-type protein NapH|nr:quinol dehydrogenase ferredoxin subunit NapH [Burkholderiales bacterium]